MPAIIPSFPGTPVAASAFNNPVGAVAIGLPAPAANTYQYLSSIAISIDPDATPTRFTVTISGLAGGTQTRSISTSTQGSHVEWYFTPSFPAASAGTQISCTVTTTKAIFVFIALTGYNVGVI